MPLLTTAGALSARALRALVPSELDVTWNPFDKDDSITLSNGNRDAACTDSSFSSVRATLGRTSGKFYFEISKPQGEPGSARCGFGDGSFNLASWLGNTPKAYGLTTSSSDNNGYTEAVNILPAAGGYFSFAFDLDLGYAWIGQNNSWLGGGNPAAGTTPAVTGITGAVYPACSLYNNGSYRLHTKTDEMQGTVPSGFAVWAAPFLTEGRGFAMVGDSISSLFPSADTWPSLTGCTHAQNHGVPSNNTTQMLERMPGILRNKPKAVFLLGGVNDLTTGVSDATGVSNIEGMIALCQAAGVPIYVQAILRVTSAYPSYVSFNNSINTKNSAFQAAVEGAGSGATWLDWRDVLLDSDYHSDGIHLVHSGNVKWASAISAYTSLYC